MHPTHKDGSAFQTSYACIFSCAAHLGRPIRLQLPIHLLHILDQILNRTHPQPKPPRKRNTPLTPHHARRTMHRLPLDRLAVLDQLADHRRGLLPGQATELDAGLGVSAALAHAAGPRAQRQHVARAAEARGGRGRVGERAAGQGAVVRRDARGDGRVRGVDGDGVGGAAGVLVRGDHLREGEAVGQGGDDGRAHVARRVPDQEGHLLGGDGLGGDDEVGFVFAVGLVEDDYELAIAWRGEMSY